jgi:hypothetical protein
MGRRIVPGLHAYEVQRIVACDARGRYGRPICRRNNLLLYSNPRVLLLKRVDNVVNLLADFRLPVEEL